MENNQFLTDIPRPSGFNHQLLGPADDWCKYHQYHRYTTNYWAVASHPCLLPAALFANSYPLPHRAVAWNARTSFWSSTACAGAQAARLSCRPSTSPSSPHHIAGPATCAALSPATSNRITATFSPITAAICDITAVSGHLAFSPIMFRYWKRDNWACTDASSAAQCADHEATAVSPLWLRSCRQRPLAHQASTSGQFNSSFTSTYGHHSKYDLCEQSSLGSVFTAARSYYATHSYGPSWNRQSCDYRCITANTLLAAA